MTLLRALFSNNNVLHAEMFTTSGFHYSCHAGSAGRHAGKCALLKYLQLLLRKACFCPEHGTTNHTRKCYSRKVVSSKSTFYKLQRDVSRPSLRYSTAHYTTAAKEPLLVRAEAYSGAIVAYDYFLPGYSDTDHCVTRVDAKASVAQAAVIQVRSHPKHSLCRCA